MTESEFISLKDATELPQLISVYMLNDRSDRTLLWGYTCERQSWHVYLQDGLIHLRVYGGWTGHPEFTLSGVEHDPDSLVPDKRLYPEACDYEFCKLLKQFGVTLSFTTFNPGREPRKYHGKLIGEGEDD